MTELTAVCRAWHEAQRTDEPAWLATLARVEGSSYRRPGARLLFGREGVRAGSVSGGCLERELVRTGPWLTRNGPICRTLELGSEDDAGSPQGSGCLGRLEILVEPLSALADGALGWLSRQLETEHRVALATVIASALPNVPLGTRVLKTDDGIVNQVSDSALAHRLEGAVIAAFGASGGHTRLVEDAGSAALVEVVDPPPHLYVFGTGVDAVPLVRLAALLGWNVTVCGSSGRASEHDRFIKLARISERTLAETVAELSRCARPLAVIMSHDYRRDRATLAALSDAPLKYLGVLGPARRTARLLSEIEAERGPLGAAVKSRIFGPAGLALGAETPEEIALSIVAEAQAALSAAPRGSLRGHTGKIHAPLALGLQGDST
jgi:xanthine/CO dehydrogenase XdhC/CoxF family maturation factor